MFKVMEFDPAIDDFAVRSQYAAREDAIAAFRKLSIEHTRGVVDANGDLVVAANFGQPAREITT
jgi:hypothetical protein